MDELYLPVLHYFENGNVFTGSLGALRFKVTPTVVMMPGDKEVDFDRSSMKAEFWHGRFCYEKSEMEGEKEFPMSREGRLEMQAWLLTQK